MSNDLLRPEPINENNIREVNEWISQNKGPRFVFPAWKGFIFRLDGKIVGIVVNGNHTLLKSHIDPKVDHRHAAYMLRFGTDWTRCSFPLGFMMSSRQSPLLEPSLNHGWFDASKDVAFLALEHPNV
jgi:hypothetical protein